jgi:Na+/H+-dicarboxylate symporter/ABC-type amino acid transport substrate-binding protein
MLIPKLSFTWQIYIGLVAGILVGITFGDLCIVFQPFASAFIKIMQITVIPLVVTTLISGIGSLKKSDAGIIARSFCCSLLLFWAIGVVSFVAMQFAYPSIGRVGLFGTRAPSELDQLNPLDLFIPSNPFSSLADGYLPAIVIFCLLLAFVLLGNNRSKPLVELSGILTEALFSITNIISRVIPFGVFVTMAYNAGTISIEYFVQLQAFFVSLVVVCLLLCVIILPLIVSSLTPFGFREIFISASRSTILAFSAGNVTITLPLIEEDLQRLLKIDDGDKRSRSLSETLVPLAYVFPTIGSFAPLLFILFAAWYYRVPMHLKDQFMLIAAGIPSVFGSSRVAVLFLLNIFYIPEDAFQLYNFALPFFIYFVSALGCMSIFSLCAICMAHLTGHLQFRKRRIIMVAVIIILLLSTSIVGLRIGFSSLLAGENHNQELLSSMTLPSGVVVISGMKLPLTNEGQRMEDIIRTKVYSDASSLPPGNSSPASTCLERIRGRQSLRVGYIPNRVPFTFVNNKGSLVGFDVQMAYDLADFLEVPLIEFIPVNKNNMADFLNNKTCDIIMTGLEPTPERLRHMKFTSTFMTLHMAFLVKDNRKDEFEEFEDVRTMQGLSIAVIKDSPNFLERFKKLFPNAEIVELNNYEEYFASDKVDALFTTTEQGSIFALIHPDYDVAQVEPADFYKVLLAYSVAKDEDSLLNLINYWIKMEEEYGGLNDKYNYWILGEGAHQKQSRWSVVKDVLHWID